MAVAPSQTRIINRALALLGSATRILHIGDGSSAASAAAALWDEARDDTLVDHPWNFALAREALPAASGRPTFQYERAFELPADWLRWLPPALGDEWWFAGEQEGNLILTNAAAPLLVRGIKRVEDVARWSVGFNSCMAYRLAADLAEPITGLAGVAERMMVGYRDRLRRAKLQDALATGDRKGRADFRSDWLDARMRGTD